MTYFHDLSPYDYALRWGEMPGGVPRSGGVPGAQNVGWLAFGRSFETGDPLESDLDLLWMHCKVAINEFRGMHPCDFCPGQDYLRPSRNGESLLLGYSEVRVIDLSGQSYAAPSLVYHYICDHHYRPPNSFLLALRSEPTPPSDAYFEALRTRQLTWGSTVR